ncbi:hypothetical protein QZH41_002314 [Actinostola sp. cb2023]|nr:hypothetical protein QZH41_002314 [Actinostola sp. cb2023]
MKSSMGKMGNMSDLGRRYIMVMKLSLAVLVFAIALGSVYGERAHKKSGGTVYPKMFEQIKYLGNWKDCDDYHTIDQAGNGCGCVFVGCTGSQECVAPSMLCGLTHSNVNSEDMKKGDCKCQWLDQENGKVSVTKKKKKSSGKI